MVPTVYPRIVLAIFLAVGADEDGTPSVYKHGIRTHASACVHCGVLGETEGGGVEEDAEMRPTYRSSW